MKRSAWAGAAIEEYRRLPEGTYVEMAASLSNLGAVLIKQGKYDKAEPFVLEGLELRWKMLGNAHPHTAMSLFRLCDLLYKKGDFQLAENAAKESIQVFSRALTRPKDNAYFANPLMELGLILNKMGRAREGEAYLREALAIRTHVLPGRNQLIGVTQGALGECLTTQKRYAEAELLLLESYATLKTVQGEQSPPTREAARRLATLYQSWGKLDKVARYQSAAAQAPPAQSIPTQTGPRSP